MKGSIRLVSCALLAPATLFAQADRLTGTWKGHAGPNGAQMFAISMDLKRDGKGGVTGPITGQRQPRHIHHHETGADATASPQGTAPDAAAALRKAFADVSGWVSKSADLVPADKYSYKPTATVRTFGQIIAHVADSYNYYCAQASGKKVEWSDPIEKGTIDKATLVPKLKQALDVCTAAYAGKGEPGPMVENVGHTNLHYGNLITYIRMLRLTPPSS